MRSTPSGSLTRDWKDLGEAAKAAGSDRSAVIRQLVNWWLRRPFARLPERPPEPGSRAPDSDGR